MTALKNYVAAPPGEIYWRREVCPHRGKNVLLKTVGGICVKGHWYGDYGQYFTAWCPMPKDGDPPPGIRNAPLLERIRFAFRLVLRLP
jgi:hypothetical protein